MSHPADESSAPGQWLDLVRDKVSTIRFGSVLITIHEGRVTQVEAMEKTRILPDRSDRTAGGSTSSKKAN